MNIRELLTDPKVHHLGALPQTAYCIPCRATGERREQSERFFDLNGTWAFYYAPDSSDVDFDGIASVNRFEGWDSIPVPSNWQTQGCDRAQYITSPYPFLFDPPHVPRRNPVALYGRRFAFHRAEHMERFFLTFEGADSCLACWLNGAFIGYAEGPHNQAVFDVTQALREGENTILVAVFKYCSGSYLDDQDKIRLSGLFRSVYILSRPACHVQDFFITPGTGGFRVSLSLTEPCGEVTLLLRSPAGECVCNVSVPAASSLTLELPVEHPMYWSAETPQLYTLRIGLEQEWVEQKLGLRTVEVRDGRFLVNGKSVKLLGVNRHEMDPDFGYVMNEERIGRDLRLMKEHNINAIRTSHYPNDPRFYELCDELGFYVIDEADMETHGCQYVGWHDYLMSDPAYEDAVTDREIRLVERDKNCTCVVIWSMGNESAWGSTLYRAAKWIKARDASRPLLMESAFSGQRGAPFEQNVRMIGPDVLDILPYMYPSYDTVESHLRMPGERRPLLAIEYCHAMGNSLGGLSGYTERFFEEPRLMGGFIWEWADHSLRGADGTLLYGGDFGEPKHHGNFCADGLVSPDRIPHSGLMELREAYSPIAFSLADNELQIANRYAFLTTQHVGLRLSLAVNGQIVSQETRDCPLLNPGETARLPLPPVPGDFSAGELVLHAEAFLKRDCGCLKEGHVLRAWHHILSRKTGQRKAPANSLSSHGADFPAHIQAFGRELAEGVDPCIWRAPLDNDRRIRLAWEGAGGENLNIPSCTIRSVKGDQTRREVEFALGGMSYRPAVVGFMTCAQHNGELRVDVRFHVRENLPVWLPRCGLMWTLPAQLSHVEYYGLGPDENYSDKRLSSHPGLYRFDAMRRPCPYLKPQECGGAEGVSFVTLTDEQGQGICVRSETPFFLNVQPWTPWEIASAAHPGNLTPGGRLYLHTDARMSGVGSASVGPDLPASETIRPGEVLNLSLTLTAYDKNRDDPFALCGLRG